MRWGGGGKGQHNEIHILFLLKLGNNKLQVTNQQAKTSRPN